MASTSTTPSAPDDAPEKALTGPEQLAEIAQHVTLDALLDRDPHAVPYTDEEWLSIITQQRNARAHFNIKEERQYSRKQGVETEAKETTVEEEN